MMIIKNNKHYLTSFPVYLNFMLHSIKIFVPLLAFLLVNEKGFAQHKIFNTADSLLLEEEHDLAIQEYNEYLNIDSLSHICYAGIGFNYFKKGDTLKAISYLDTSLIHQPDYLAGLFHLGYILQHSDSIEAAKFYYTKATRLLEHEKDEFKSRNAAATFNNLGTIFMKNEHKPDSAISMYTKAIALDSAYLTAFQNRGKAYVMNRQFEKARVDLEKAKSLNGELSFIDYYLFYVYWNIHEHELAYDLLVDKNLNLSNDVDFRLAGLICYLNSDDEKALKYYKKIKNEEKIDEDYVYLAYLSYLLDESFCEYYNEVDFKRLKKDPNTLKTSLKKYKIVKKECRKINK